MEVTLEGLAVINVLGTEPWAQQSGTAADGSSSSCQVGSVLGFASPGSHARNRHCKKGIIVIVRSQHS